MIKNREVFPIGNSCFLRVKKGKFYCSFLVFIVRKGIKYYGKICMESDFKRR